jgi:hypothetical protein
MIKNIIKFLKCKISGHKLIYGGACPFTGMSYDNCEKCDMMIPRQAVE